MIPEILIISPEFGYGGMGLHTSKVANFLLDKGFRVKVHTTKKSKETAHLSHSNLQTIGIVRSFPYFDKFNPFFDLISSFGLNKTKPHLIIRPLPQFYFHIPHISNKKVPELVIVHETFADMIRAIRLSKGSTLIDNLLCSKFSTAFMKSEKNILRKSERIVAVSEYTKKRLTNFYGIKTEKVEVIYSPIDTRKFRRKSPQEITSRIGNEIKKFKNNRPLVVFVGRTQNVKNLRLFFDLIARLIHDTDLRFAIVGISADDRQVRYYTHSIEYQNLFFLGYLHNDFLPDVYSLADFMLITSISENLPTCLLEAMACGVIPISANIGGIPEVIQDKKNGFLIHSNSREEFLTTMHQLVRNNYSIKAISRNAQKTVKEKCEEKIFKKRFVEIITRITSNR